MELVEIDNTDTYILDIKILKNYFVFTSCFCIFIVVVYLLHTPIYTQKDVQQTSSLPLLSSSFPSSPPLSFPLPPTHAHQYIGGEDVPQSLSMAVRQNSPNWENDITKMIPSEILWAYLRCDYARKFMTNIVLSDFVDALVPDMIKLCSLLDDSKSEIGRNPRYQMVVQYLLKMTNFIDISDECGCKELSKVCEEMLYDTNLPELLVDPMLKVHTGDADKRSLYTPSYSHALFSIYL